MSSARVALAAERQEPMTMLRRRTSVSVLLFALCLLGCTEAQIVPSSTNPSPSPGRSGDSGPTATAARKQNWSCQKIERAIANLIEPMRSAKARAESEQEQMAPTLARMAARLSGPPGAGNAALAEFEGMRSDASQLSELLREKGCASTTVDVEPPAFLQP